MKKLKGLIIVVAVILGLGFVGSLLPDEPNTESTTNSVVSEVNSGIDSIVENDKLTTSVTSTATTNTTTAITTTMTTTKTTAILGGAGKYSAVVKDSSSLPKYNGSAYAVVNNNNPQFSASDKKNTTAFETYSSLDSLGRCGVAYANICKEIMPTEERGEIGSVKPTGWHTVKYDCVDGKYLYNRCHLIGFQLAGENANTRNLITGTRYMNVQGMLPFENMVDDYVDETHNHVLYRVTPVFVGNELLARGVRIEAWSVEDAGDGICFNVFCFNVQPGVSINYATGESSLNGQNTSNAATNKATTKSTTNKTTTKQNNNGGSSANYIVNKNTGKFHYPSCSSVGQMNESNKWNYNGSRDELINQGYEPCKRCNP